MKFIENHELILSYQSLKPVNKVLLLIHNKKKLGFFSKIYYL